MSTQNEWEKAIFRYEEKFNGLTGRTKSRFVVGDGSDPRSCHLLYEVGIRHHWKTQRPKRHPQGFIRFSNGEDFDVATETVNRLRAYIFPKNEALAFLWRRQHHRQRILRWLEKAPLHDVLSLTSILADYLDPLLPQETSVGRLQLHQKIRSYLEGLGVREMAEVAELVETGKTNVPAA